MTEPEYKHLPDTRAGTLLSLAVELVADSLRQAGCDPSEGVELRFDNGTRIVITIPKVKDALP